jgi:hypothetical protein
MIGELEYANQEQRDESSEPHSRLGDDHDGRDEMNLVELPLSSIADRFLDGKKTVVFTDEIFDRDIGQRVKRELAISGSDRYGLPTARDEDVLLACVQLASRQEFRSREVRFSRYKLLKILRWPDEGKYYQRLATSLRRWKGVTIYSNRAFYDHGQKSWVNRDFGVLDNLYIYEREAAVGSVGHESSWLLWNEVLFASFQAGYLKRLDWDLYCRLTSPVAKRLYRLLDKRFYYGNEVVLDLHQLAVRKIRLSDGYNTAQIKRALLAGIRELEALWDLRPLPVERRFVKRARGQWEVVFERRRERPTKAKLAREESQSNDLIMGLTRREIGPAMAAELVEKHPAEIIHKMVALFDWYAASGQTKGPGFLVDSIRNPEKYRFPREFAEKRQQSQRPERLIKSRREILAQQSATALEVTEQSRDKAFQAFWKGLGPDRRYEFETAAVQGASTLKRDGYRRSRQEGGTAFQEYRHMILRDHFERTKTATAHPGGHRCA